MAGNFAYADVNADRIAELQQQIHVLEEQKEQLQGSIAETSARAGTLNAEIARLKSQVTTLQVQIQLTGKKIDQTSLQITDVQQNIVVTESKIDYQKDTIGEMLQYLYQRDNESFVGVLMKNATLSEYFNQEQYALSVNDKLITLVDSLKDAKDNLAGQKNDLEGKKTDLVTLKQELDVQKNSVVKVQNDTSSLLKQTKGQEAAYQKMLSEVEKKQANFFAELQSLESDAITGGKFIVHVSATCNPPKGSFVFPEDTKRLTQGYGMTAYAKRGAYGGAPHNGIDNANGYGTPIHAIADGTIIANGGNNPGWGNWVAIQHQSTCNFVSIYGHMSTLAPLKVGTAVKQSQVIGYEGATGNVTGAHLHLSIYKDFFTYVNPKKNDDLYFNYYEGTVNPLNYY